MGWLKKLLGKEESREEWLAAHPGKESKKSEAPPVDLEQEARTRATMEGEMDAAREKRGN
ncbi:MAG: hypothetical protein C0506_00435 [Anaerolinea sp.]|nr:hypothetical protein [Anaerolinea sp.]